MKRSLSLFLLAALCCGTASALDVGGRVDNFRLLDHNGKSHELYYLSDKKAVVLMTHAQGCDVVSKSIPALNALAESYRDRGVATLMINSSLDADHDEIAAGMAKTGSSLPVLDDKLQLVGESLGATRAGEVFVIDPKEWKLVYRGPVDAKAAGKSGDASYAADAVDALLNNAPVKVAKVEGPGCAVKLPELAKREAHANISYEKTIAPMLMEKCVTCHREGGIGPWQMASYEMVRGFAPMIREVVRMQRMPPWHADPHYGVFSNDRSLSDEQTKALVHWIEAGAPRGSGADPLKSQTKDWPEWQGGKPDLIVETPAFTVPATGTIDYQNPIVKNTFGKDVWVRAIEFNPGDRGVVHHILAYGVKQGGSSEGFAGLGTYLAGYVPGGGYIKYPEDTGVLLKKDMDFRFQMHYTASGKPATDVTKIGLYVTEEPPKYPLRQFVLLDPRLRIPPHTKEHTITAPPRTFDRDVMIYSLTAHSHYRGKSSKFVATYPDGREEILLSVPHYDFNWQTAYELAQPKILPKGTKLTYTTTYDNSSQNKANPDPSIEVRWGEQSWEEMIYGNVRYRFLDETVQDAQAAKR